MLRRHRALFEQQGVPYLVRGERVYRRYGAVVRPFGPVVWNHDVTPADARAILGDLKGKILWTGNGVTPEKPQAWYATVAPSFVPVDALGSKKRRYNVRQALKSCAVRRISVEELLADGYAVFVRAFERYRGDSKPWSEATFRKFFEPTVDFQDVMHHWGAFHDGKMIGISSVNVFGEIEAGYWMARFDPEHSRQLPMYALIYRMNEYYLGECGMRYANDGWRSVSHDTEMQGFLTRVFGFENWGCGITVHYQPPFGLLMKLTYPLRKHVSRLSGKYQAVCALEEAARQSARTARMTED